MEQGWGDTGNGGRMAVEAGKEVQLLTLTHGTTGMSASIMTLGCILVDLHVADGSGRRDDSSNVVLGFDSLQRYLDGHPAFGALCGRVAGRIANSSLPDGTALSANSGPHHLHGGVQGFMAKVWNAEIASQDPEAPAVRLSYVSEAGEEGYPGTLTTSCTYTLTAANGLRIDYTAEVAGAGARRPCPSVPLPLSAPACSLDLGSGQGQLSEVLIDGLRSDAGQPNEPHLLRPGRSRLRPLR